MTPEELKDIRHRLGITQETLATILGVTKTSVGRYEMGLTRITGTVERKLLHLRALLDEPGQRSILEDLLRKKEGIAAAAGLVAFSTVLFPMAGLLGLGLTGLAASKAGVLLQETLKKLADQAGQEQKGQSEKD